MLDFLGIGAQKAATTWLYTWLGAHPNVSFPAGKEVHYWDTTPNPDGLPWQAMFEASSVAKQGEITPAYALLDTKYVEMIGHMFPALRVFYSLRNPIERSWAQVRMRYKNGNISIDNIPAVLDFCASPQCAQRSNYVETIQRWRTVFGDQLHCLFYDDIVADPQTVLVRLAEHIRVDADWFRSQASGVAEKVFAGVNVPMPEEVRAYLSAKYKEPICALSRLLNRDLSSWLTSADRCFHNIAKY